MSAFLHPNLIQFFMALPDYIRQCFGRMREQGEDSDRRVLYAFDFDKTILHSDSTLAISSLRQNRVIPSDILLEYRKKKWASYFQQYLDYVILNEGLSLDSIMDSLMRCQLVPGMKELLERVMLAINTSNSKFVIISGGNNYFVSHYLGNLFPKITPSKIISNIATRIEDPVPRLRFQELEMQQNCKFCPSSLCKGNSLETYAKENGPFEKIFYFGDGSNDLCAAMRLRASDVLFVRKDYKMANAIASGLYKGVPITIKANIIYFQSGYEILAAMKF